MSILYTAKDKTGAVLHSEVIEAHSWREANARGFVYRNVLKHDGIKVEWSKA